MAAIALTLLANSYYDSSNTKETRQEIEHKLAAYRAAPVQTVEAVIGALSNLELLTNSAQVLCLSILEQAITAAFQSLPDEARSLVYDSLLKLSLPVAGGPVVSTAVQSVASKVLAKVVALSYAITFQPFMGELLGQLRAGSNVPQCLRLLFECLVGWLGDGGRGGVSAPNRGDPFQASVRLARNAIVANMASVLELLMSLLAARPAPDAGPAAAAALARFDSEVTQQVLSILEHLAKVLPDPAALLLSEDLLRMLSYFSAAVVNPGAAASDVNNGTAALEVLSVLVQRGITRGAGGAGGEAVAGMRSQLMQLCITLLAVACGTDPAAGTPDLATATARLSDMEIDCAWALHGFTAAACTHLLPAVEGDPSFPALRFCHLLFTFTLAQPDTDGFIRLLRLWGDLAERVAAPPSAGSPLSPAAGAAEAAAARRESYTSAFRSLAGQLLGKVLYSSNAPGLESLSDDAEAEDEEERAAEGVLVGVRFGGEAGMMGAAAASSPSSTGAVSSSSATSAVGAGGGHGRMMSGAGDDAEDGSGFMRGPPSVHRISVRTRLPSSAFTARPLQVNVFAASGTGLGPAAGPGGSGRFDGEDEDDEMQQAAALSVGTALADSRESTGDDEGEGGGADGFGSPVGGGGGGAGGGGVAGSGAAAPEDAGPRMSERGRYIQAALLLLSKLAALPAVAEEVLGSAGASLQAGCTALAAALAAAAAAGSGPVSAFSGGQPGPFAPPAAGHLGGRSGGGGSGGSPETELRRHACDVAVLFTLLADVGPAIVHASAASQQAILTMAGQMLALALAQGWNLRGAGPLTRVIAAALITARAFLPVLNAYARQALALDGGVGAAEGGAAPLGIETVVSLLNDAVAPALQLLDCTLSPPPAGVADAAIALLVQLSQQPQLRVIARTPAVPALQGMLLADGGAGWRRLLNGLPSSHQAHALLAALRVILAAAPTQQGAAGRAGGLASPPGAVAGAAAVSAAANPMAAALLAADPPPEARSEGAAALLQPLTAVLTEAVAPPAAGSGGGAPPRGEGFVALLTDAAALGPRVSRAVGLLCAALSGAGEAGSGPALQSVLGNALAPILTGSCAAVCQLVDAAASPLSAGALAASPSGRYGGSTPFRGGAAGFGVAPGVTATLERSRSFGAASPYAVAPLLAAAELLRLLSASVGALRRSLPDQYLMQVLSVLGPQLSRLHELSGDAGAGSISGGGGVAGVGGGGGGRGLTGKASAGLLPSILYLLRLLRACAAQGPPTPGGPAAAAQGSAAGELRCALMSAACGTVRALAQPAGFRFSEEIAPAAMTLVRAVLRSQWRSLVGPPSVDPATGQRSRAFANAEAAEQVAACSGLFVAWLSNASASPELFRFALLNVLALQREVGLWQVPHFREACLPELEVTLLDALVRGERPTLAEEVSKALVGMASAHREDFAARVLPAWMARCLGAENIPAVAGRLDPAVGAALTSAAASEGDYGDALLCLVSTVRSWQLITQEALAVAGGSTVPLYS